MKLPGNRTLFSRTTAASHASAMNHLPSDRVLVAGRSVTSRRLVVQYIT